MSIIDSEMTLEQKQEKTRYELKAHMINGARDQYTRMQLGWGYVWNNPYGLTPQQVADSLGTKALAVFQLQALAKSVVDAVDPTIWQLGARPGTITPVLVDGVPTGCVTIVMNE